MRRIVSPFVLAAYVTIFGLIRGSPGEDPGPAVRHPHITGQNVRFRLDGSSRFPFGGHGSKHGTKGYHPPGNYRVRPDWVRRKSRLTRKYHGDLSMVYRELQGTHHRRIRNGRGVNRAGGQRLALGATRAPTGGNGSSFVLPTSSVGGNVPVGQASLNSIYATVSPVGLSTAGVTLANNGFMFGVDSTLYTGTLGTTANAIPFSSGKTTTTKGIQEAIVWVEAAVSGTATFVPGTVLLLPGVNFNGQVFLSQSYCELRGVTDNSADYDSSAPPYARINQVSVGVSTTPTTQRGNAVRNCYLNELDFFPYQHITFFDVEDCGLAPSTTAGKGGLNIQCTATYGSYVQYIHFKGTMNILDANAGGGALNWTGYDSTSSTAHFHFDHIVYTVSGNPASGTNIFNIATNTLFDRVTVEVLDMNFSSSTTTGSSVINIAGSSSNKSDIRAFHIGTFMSESHGAPNYFISIAAFSGGHYLSIHLVIDRYSGTGNLTIFNNSNTATGWSPSALNEIVILSGIYAGPIGTTGIVTATAGVPSAFVITLVNLLTLVPAGFNAAGLASGGQTVVAVPASGSASPNLNPWPVQLVVLTVGATFSAYKIIDRQGNSQTFTFAVLPGAVLATIPSGGSITPTWTGTAPTWATNGL